MVPLCCTSGHHLQLLFMPAFDILYSDSDILAISKPPGLLCVPGLSHPENLLDMARARFPAVRTVHRLDMATSGIIIFALNYNAQKHLSKQFEQRRVKKRYAAIVHGRVTSQKGEIYLPLSCDWPNRPRQQVDWHKGKVAHTYFEVQQTLSECTRLHLYPVTGRSHQLRVHCLGLGHPIVGDELYAHADGAERLMLHAECIEFTHPTTQQLVKLQCPPPFTGAPN